MAEGQFKQGIAGGRLSPTEYADNFSDLHPPLDHHEALVESDRCYFCYDAPCMQACPTSIDIPLFIREIATGNPLGSAKTIFDQNILGGMCARVCPTETLCEEACVRNVAEGKPVKIGRLQRYATDIAMAPGQAVLQARRADRQDGLPWSAPARPASPCAHRLPRYGHDVTIFDARPKVRRPQRIRHRRLQDAPTISRRRRSTTSLSIGGIDDRERPGARPRLPADRAAPRPTTPCSSAWASAASTRCAPTGEDAEGVEDAVEFIADLAPGRRSGGAAGRPQGGGDRRRHDGDRRCRAVEAARRRGGDDLLPPRQGAHERVRVRAGTRHRQRRRHPPLAAAEARDLRRTARSPASNSNTRRCEDGRLVGTGETVAHRRRSGVQGDRPELSRRRRSTAAARHRARRRPHRGRCRGPHIARQGLGRRRLRPRRRRPDRLGRRAGPRRGAKAFTGHSPRNGRA